MTKLPIPQEVDPVRGLVEALEPFFPITIVENRDYAEVTFGEHQTQAMTMAPQDWLNLDAALSFYRAWEEGRGSDSAHRSGASAPPSGWRLMPEKLPSDVLRKGWETVLAKDKDGHDITVSDYITSPTMAEKDEWEAVIPGITEGFFHTSYEWHTWYTRLFEAVWATYIASAPSPGAALEAAGVDSADTLSDPISFPPASAPPEGVRVGEQLRCIHGNRDFLHKGRIYTVREVWAGDLVGLTIWPGHLFGLWRFTRDAAPPPPAGVDRPETEGEKIAREDVARIIHPGAFAHRPDLTGPFNDDPRNKGRRQDDLDRYRREELSSLAEMRKLALSKADQIIALLAQQKERG